jgi:hypothetical protein
MSMSRGLPVHDGQLVARSLKVTKTTHLLVASIAAGIAANASVAMPFTGAIGPFALSALIFASLSIGAWAISTEIFSRSSQTVSNLRSIGATTKSLSSAVLMPVLLYGIMGSAVGAGVGAAIGLLLGGPVGIGVFFETLSVVLSSAAGTAVGVYVGGRGVWLS